MKSKPEDNLSEMRAEYDFSGGVRGKYARSLRENGYPIRVFNNDGSFSDMQVLGEKIVVIAPDVWEYFPSSEAVNAALRTLIALARDSAVHLVREAPVSDYSPDVSSAD